MNRNSKRIILAVSLTLLTLFSVPNQAFADDFEDFEAARQAYERGDYPLATERFEQLLGGNPPRLSAGPIRLESRKFYAASLLYVGQPDAAYEQFVLLLQEDETYQLDSVEFSAEIIEVFENARDSLRLERARREQEALEREEALTAEREANAAALAAARERLFELASQESVEEVHSRWVTLLPFGVGQFYNGHNTLGVTLALIQGLSLTAGVITFFSHESLRDARPQPEVLSQARDIEKLLRVGNWIANGIFLASYTVGVVDAQLRFVETRRTTRSRELPSDLRDAVRLSLHPGGLNLQIGF